MPNENTPKDPASVVEQTRERIAPGVREQIERMREGGGIPSVPSPPGVASEYPAQKPSQYDGTNNPNGVSK